MTAGALHNDFRHEALFYAGREELLAATTSFVREGIASDEAVLVVLSTPKIDALRSALGADAEQVEFADMGEVGANPARIIPAWRDFADHNAGRRLRGIGEPIDSGRSPAELVECQRHESLLNLAFADASGFYLLCPYDTESLADDVLEEARRSHPHLASSEGAWDSEHYRGLEAAAAPFDDPLPEPSTRPDSRVFQSGTIAALRAVVAGHARAAGFGADAIEDLVLAVDEVATNSVLHGGGGGILRVWPEGHALICEVQDRGLVDDPLAGRQPPRAGQQGGFGLWLANQLCDLVQLRSSARSTTVRLHMARR